MSNSPKGRPVLAIDGTESMEGRALLVISALRFCVDWLHSVDVRMIDVTNEDVVLALQCLTWEYGLDIQVNKSTDESPLGNADLYVGIAFRSGAHLRLAEAGELDIPCYIAIQFPEPEWLSESTLCHTSASFDPRIFASELRDIIDVWL